MTVNIVQATPVHAESWDKYVSAHSQATPYHRYAWVQSVEQAYKHKNASLVALEEDQVVGIFPCIGMKKPFSSIKYCALPFCDIGFGLADNQDILRLLQTHATERLKNSGGTSLEYRDSEHQTVESQEQGMKVRMVLPLPDSADELMSSFKSKLRSQVRKSEKNGLTYKIANNQQQLDNFYQIFAINMRKLGSPVHSKKWFEALLKNYAEHIHLSVVYNDNTPIGAGIVLKNKDRLVIPWASTVAEYNRLAPNMMLYWSLLKLACDLGCKEFDFGRSSFGEGTFKFKKQWGAEPIPLKWSDIANPSPTEADEHVQSASKIRPMVENIWSKLPLGLTTSLGPIIRRHISL